MNKPIMKIVAGPSPTQTGISDAATAGLGSVMSAASKAADVIAHDDDGLLQILHYRKQVAIAAKRRSRWFGGRLYNKMTGEDPDYIPISGTHLRQTFSIINFDAPDFIVASGQYQLRTDFAEEAVDALQKKRSA